MANIFNVAGPVLIQVKHNPAGSYVDLGRSDNDDLVSAEQIDHLNPQFSNDFGNAPADVVHCGIEARVYMTLVKWDEVVYAALFDRIRAGAAGTEGTATGAQMIGQLLIGGAAVRTIGVKVITTISGQKSYEFPVCFPADQHRQTAFGNTSKRLGLTFVGIRDSSNRLYIVSTNV